MFCPIFRRRQRRPHVLNYSDMAELNFAEVVSRYETLSNEYQICRRKLDSKCEALLILSKELDQCRSERDQFKLMAEQLRERYQALKRQLAGQAPLSPAHNILDPRFYTDMHNQSLARLLCDTKEQNKSMQFEVEDLKQKLYDAQGDIKLLREQIARQRVGTTDEGITTRHFPAYEREDLVRQLEAGREQYLQLERDLQQVLDEKEEQETERDAYKGKYERLNQELNYILKGDEKRILDIDALVMENKYLQERLKQMEEEKTMAMATVSKYKSMLERKKNKGILKLGQSRSGGLVITQKQVHQILQSQSSVPVTPQTVSDLQALCGGLLETINDKNLALCHQRKTNKILGNRVAELEKKLKTLEVSGLWNVPGSLQKLKLECEEVKMLVPRQTSTSSETSEKIPDLLDDLDSELSSPPSSTTSSPRHAAFANTTTTATVNMEDLDLLPTKDDSGQRATSPLDSENTRESPDCTNISASCGALSIELDKSKEEDHQQHQQLSAASSPQHLADEYQAFMQDVSTKICRTSPLRDIKGSPAHAASHENMTVNTKAANVLLMDDDEDEDDLDRSASPSCEEPLLKEESHKDHSSNTQLEKFYDV